MADLKKLKLDAEGFSVLYVEDNEVLRANASKLLQKFFDTVYTAADGKEGLEAFKKNSPQIVVTDIKMPHMDGMELIKNIKDISPETKVIIMSAFDDSSYLFSAIEFGVFRYLKKPVNITNFAEVLHECVLEIIKEQNTQLFNAQLNSIFNYQSSMVIMIKESEPTFANQMFLDYFEVKNIEKFIEIYQDIGNLFLEHDSFLYNSSNKNWFDDISVNPQKLYNVKMKDKDGSFKHFILKYQDIPDKESYGILSFDDVSELNLLKLYDEKASKNDESLKDSKAMFKLLEVVKRNNAKIELHNYYKGLSITNDAVITEIKDNSVTVKTKYLQQKAIQLEQRTLILSDALPYAVECCKVVRMSFEKQNVILETLRFTPTSPITRKTVRVVPDEKQTVSLFVGENKFHGDIEIEDISLNAVKLKLNALPAGLEIGSSVHLDIVLEMDKKPLIINTKATIFTKREFRHSFSIVFMFDDSKKNELVKYITKRQMAIIREFKGLQNG